MRGKAKKTKTLVISGKTHLQGCGAENKAAIGDVLLSPQIDNKNNFVIDEDLYHQNGHRGYLRAHVYDGKNWGNLNSNEIFQDKENNFSKTELAIDTAQICITSIASLAGTALYRTYRDHYTIYQYTPGEFKGKKGHFGKK